MEQNLQNQFLSLLADTLERNDPITLEDEFRSYKEWDSLALLSVLAALEEEFDVIIPRNDFLSLHTINDLFQHVITHQGEHD